jgi:hypothetical protein
MTRLIVPLLAAAALAACTAEVKEEGEQGMAAGSVVEMIAFSDVAGKWSVSAMAEGSDSVLLTYEFMATNSDSGWTVTFPGRAPISAHVMPPTADSIVMYVGPYESALRPGVQTTTTAVVRLKGGELTGSAVARYATTGADSVLRLVTIGKRM